MRGARLAEIGRIDRHGGRSRNAAAEICLIPGPAARFVNRSPRASPAGQHFAGLHLQPKELLPRLRAAGIPTGMGAQLPPMSEKPAVRSGAAVNSVSRPAAGQYRHAPDGLRLGRLLPVLERLLLTWDVYSATLGRQLFGTIALFAVLLANPRRSPLPRLVSWRRILLLGFLGVTLGSLLTSIGVQYSSGLSSAIISTTNPVTAALTAAVLYREPLGRAIVLGNDPFGRRRARLGPGRRGGRPGAFPGRGDPDHPRQCDLDLDVHGGAALAQRL